MVQGVQILCVIVRPSGISCPHGFHYLGQKSLACPTLFYFLHSHFRLSDRPLSVTASYKNRCFRRAIVGSFAIAGKLRTTVVRTPELSRKNVRFACNHLANVALPVVGMSELAVRKHISKHRQFRTVAARLVDAFHRDFPCRRPIAFVRFDLFDCAGFA